MYRPGWKILLSCSCLAVAAGALAETGDSGPGILESMTAEQYRAAGLHKLTEEELEALDGWLRSHTSPTAPDSGSLSEVRPEPVSPEAAVAATRSTGAASGTQTAPRAVDENFGFPAPPPDPEQKANELHASVLPPFRGWSGKTVFKLDNGQVWRQRNAGRFTYSGDDTRVVISKNSWGFYEMRLVEADRSVGVSRVK